LAGRGIDTERRHVISGDLTAFHDQGPSRFYASVTGIGRDQQRFLNYFDPGTRVVDLGCGDGFFVAALRDRGVDATGVDLSQAAVDRCHQKGLSTVVCQDVITFLRETGASFDGAFAAHLIEHLPPDGALELLRLCREHLNPGGHLVMITPNPTDLSVISEVFWLDLTHVRPYPLPLLTEMMTDTGLTVVEKGHYQSAGLSRRGLFRRRLLRLLLGKHYGQQNSYAVAVAGTERR